MRNTLLFSTAAGIIFVLSSCKKDAKIETPLTPVSDPPVLVFDYKASMNDRALTATAQYTNAAGDSLTITKLNYYISNIKLKRDDGSLFAEPESYHLNKHLEGKQSFNISGVPAGTYTGIEFLIGVDSLRNTSGSQTGVLSVNEDMFWTWNTGYVFFKLEGDANTLTDPNWNSYSIHVGGFSGANNSLQKVYVPLSQPLVAKNGQTTKVIWHVHADEIFENPTVIGFDDYRGVSGGRPSKTVSANYKDMFEVSRIEN